MADAFAMIAGTALEYGVRMLAWLEGVRTFLKVDVL